MSFLDKVKNMVNVSDLPSGIYLGLLKFASGGTSRTKIVIR